MYDAYVSKNANKLKKRGIDVNRNTITSPLEYNFHKERQILADLFSLVFPD